MPTTLPAGWKLISSAPKDGTEILAWREDCGQFIAKYTSADAFPMTQDELDAMDEETLFAKDWFTQWPDATRLDGSEAPTLWQPLPVDPCATCNNRGAVGNILNAEPCPDCTPASVAPGDAQDERQAFEAWFIKRGVWPRVTYEEVFAAGWNSRPVDAPAAGDALDAQAAVRSLQRYGFGYADDGNGARYLSSLKSDDGAFLRRDEVLAALAAQVPQQGEA